MDSASTVPHLYWGRLLLYSQRSIAYVRTLPLTPRMLPDLQAWLHVSNFHRLRQWNPTDPNLLSKDID